uniref:AAA family ATPase n=1 Tax=Prevotella sp. TaxID=59823 RepID=UPI00402A58C7
MIKRKIDSYLEHFFEQNKKALLLTGARQIGKTFSIRRLGHEHFEHFVEINFIESPNLVSVFSKATSGQGYLSSYLHDHVHPKGAATPDQL